MEETKRSKYKFREKHSGSLKTLGAATVFMKTSKPHMLILFVC